MDIFKGKTLLMLGSNAGSTDMIQYARSKGAYLIVADYLPPEKSEAKLCADEAVLISTGDVEALKTLIREKHVDGVLSGISEFNLLRAMELSEYFGMNFYCNREQWSKIENKDEFRRLCEEYDVPCPKTYFVGEDLADCDLKSLVYPLVIKPVDCAASQGVHICMNENELREVYPDSKTSSERGYIIIEEYVQGDEFTAHYSICNGRVSFSCMDNRYPIAVHEGKVTTIPIARIYPSTYIDSYMEKVNPAMIRLCESLGIVNGVLFIQGIYNRTNGNFYIFEAGLRSAAETPNRFIDRINGINYMNNIVDYCLLGRGTMDQSKEDPYMHGKCCGVISFVARQGTVGAINGLEEAIKAVPSVVTYESRYPVGSVTPDTDTLRQLMIRFVMICTSREQMAKDVAYLNENIEILDENGNDMVLKIKPERILSEFSVGGGNSYLVVHTISLVLANKHLSERQVAA